jgi:hypothetical protein
MCTRPQTIGSLVADSPVRPRGLAPRPRDDHLRAPRAPVRRTAVRRHHTRQRAGHTSLYWLTNTATSAARLYWQLGASGRNFYAAADVDLPAAVSVVPDEYVNAPRSWNAQAYHDLIYFNEAAMGGHFAAWDSGGCFGGVARGLPHTPATDARVPDSDHPM